MSLSWYLKRLRTFSAGEVFFRVRQRVRTHILDNLRQDGSGTQLSIPDSEIVKNPDAHCYYPVFDQKLDIFKEIDWHLDLSTGKRFPQTFAHKIDIRSDRYGSAKHVWEVNRMQFLLYLAGLYKSGGDLKHLVLFCHHLGMWRNANPYMVGVNWYSNIEVNLRLICWAFCWQLLDIDSLRKENSAIEEFVTEAWWPMICEHAEYSYRHPSLCSSANNHLISEYAGLFVAACVWNIPHRNARLKYAKAGLEREILKQNTAEGVNREEAAEYIRSSHVLTNTSAHLIAIDTLSGLSTRPKLGTDDEYDVSYQRMDLLGNMEWIDEIGESINIQLQVAARLVCDILRRFLVQACGPRMGREKRGPVRQCGPREV